MIPRHLVCIVLGMVCCVSTGAQGALLFTRSLTIDRSANVFETEQFGLKIDFSSSLLTPATNSLFQSVVITPASAGQSFAALPGDAGFATVAAQLTDALNQGMKFVMTEIASARGEGRGYTQSQLFSKPPTAPDFSGKVIDKIELKINQFTLVFPAPGGAQASSTGKPVELNFTFNVFGHNVPEPSSLGLLGAAALAALSPVVRKRRR